MSDLLNSGQLHLPGIGLGCMSLPERFADAQKIIHRALDSEISFFDTADLYQKGKNEENLGKALRGRRGELILATKVGNQWNPDGKSWTWNPRKERSEERRVGKESRRRRGTSQRPERR